MTLLISPDVNFKLSRLCDSQHPHEVGGYILGVVDVNYSVTDIFPVPNTSEQPYRSYGEHPSGREWAGLYAQTVGLTIIGRFHGHPNGSVVSEGDVRSCGGGLHLWVIHHRPGEHTYTAAHNLQHVEVVVQGVQMEARQPMLVGGRLNLGDVWLTQFGELEATQLVMRLLRLDEKSRHAYVAALTAPKDRRGAVPYEELAKMMHTTPRTARKWMKPCISQGLIQKGFGVVKVQKPA